MSEVSHLPQLVKVQKESLKETIEFEWHCKLHKCVESIHEIWQKYIEYCHDCWIRVILRLPKLKFITYSKANGKQVHQEIGELRYILQEFQYGKDGFQTTTNKDHNFLIEGKHKAVVHNFIDMR